MHNSIKKVAEDLVVAGRSIYVSENIKDYPDFIPNSKNVYRWFNDVFLFAERLPDGYPLKDEIKKTYVHRKSFPIFHPIP